MATAPRPPPRRCAAGRAGSRSPPPEAEELRVHFPEVPILGDGRAHRGGAAQALAAGATSRSGGPTSASSARGSPASAASPPAGPRQARQRHGRSASATRGGRRAGRACGADPALELAGVWTHFATADEAGDDFFGEQLAAFRPGRRAGARVAPGVHGPRGQQRGDLRDPASHFDMVRCGIAIYGLDPFGADPAEQGSSRRWSCAPTSPT